MEVQKSLIEIVAASTVVATIISGLVSLVVSKLEFAHQLKLSKHDRVVELSVEAINVLQNALNEIDMSENRSELDNGVETQIIDAVITMFQRAVTKMSLAKQLLDRIAYLIPETEEKNLRDTINAVEEMYTNILASVYKHKGIEFREDSTIKFVDKDNLYAYTRQYIDAVQNLIKLLRNAITKKLRSLCEM